MIGEAYQEKALLVKEMLSSEGGYYDESMAPLIGGNRPHRGRVEPLNMLMQLRRREYDAGTFHGTMEDVYHVFPLVIDEEANYVMIYKEEDLPIEFAYRFFEMWCAAFYEEKIN